MRKALNIIAIFFIVLGIVGFAISFDDIKEAKRTSEFWEQSASENYDNELIKAEADKEASAYVTKIVLSVSMLISGIIVGIFFLALSKIISVLESIRDKRIEVSSTPS